MNSRPISACFQNRTHLCRSKNVVRELRNQPTDRSELRFASHQAADFLERRLFFRAKGVRILAGLIELLMSAAKFVTACESRNQMKVLVEFVPDVATRRRDAFQHRKSNDAVLDGGLNGSIVLEQCFVQIAPRKQ